MNMISTVGAGCDATVDALRAEFGAVLAARIIEAEALDFLWDARISERYLGQHSSVDFDDEDRSRELSRVAILSVLDRHWHAGTCLVDGDGTAVELIWKRSFGSRREAEMLFDQAR